MDSRDRSAAHLGDKIYSLRGITHDALAAGIEVGYNQSIESVSSTLLLPSWVT